MRPPFFMGMSPIAGVESSTTDNVSVKRMDLDKFFLSNGKRLTILRQQLQETCDRRLKDEEQERRLYSVYLPRQGE